MRPASSLSVKTTARLPGATPIAVDVGAHRAGQHHAGPVVAAEHDGRSIAPAASTARLATMLPEALARLMRRRHRQMVGDPLHRAIGAAVIDAEHGGAAQERHSGRPRARPRPPRPSRAPGAVDLVALRQQPPAEAEILLAQDHARARRAGGERGRQARPGPRRSPARRRTRRPSRSGRGRARRRRGRARRRGGSAARRASPRRTPAT